MYKLNNIEHLQLEITEKLFKLVMELERMGDDIALSSLGINRELAKQLRKLNMDEVSRLSAFPVQIIHPRVDNRILELSLGRIKEESAQNNFYEDLIIHGATLSFLEEFTTIDKREFTRRRKQFGLSGSRKTKAPSIDESVMIDNLWEQLPENMDNIEKYLFSAKKLKIPISKIWTYHKEMGVF